MTEHSLTEDYRALYRRAFEEFGAMALWNSRRLPEPTSADALAVARVLRIEGNLAARVLAERIEAACRAAH
jgi:hypothetical protein